MVKVILEYAFRKSFAIVLILAVSWSDASLKAQVGQTSYNFFYRVCFRDKGEYTARDFRAEDLLSPRAIERRNRAGIQTPHLTDLPVWQSYLTEISSLGYTLHSVSKWMNCALYKTTGPMDTEILLSLPYVTGVAIVKNISTKNGYSDKLDFFYRQAELPPYDNPVRMLGGNYLHTSGFDGTGILIAVLDGGFRNAENIPALESLRRRKGIKGTYDFVLNTESVYGHHHHGTAVLSVLAGDLPNLIKGSATGAQYLLLRTEDDNTEYPVEEDHWVAGAEYADSSGADIITSSLGYSTFDDPDMNYKYSDMNGNSTFVTKAADIAASKGILVVNSAGNERDNDWSYIIAPADGDSVLAVGAVDAGRVISSFSSAGPSADNRVKPDVAAQGVDVPVQFDINTVARANGTSFSCPVISGMCACLMQAAPYTLNHEILNAVLASSDRFSQPDSLYGYGIPDIAKAITILQNKYLPANSDSPSVGPNPFEDHLNIIFRENPERLRVEIFNLSGKLMLIKEFDSFTGRYLRLYEPGRLQKGLYIIRMSTEKEVYKLKILKVSN